MANMRIKSVRFGPRQEELIARAADLEGVTVSQYIRDSASGRAWLDLLRRGDPEALALLEAAGSHSPLHDLLREDEEQDDEEAVSTGA